jgi:hypothetical protein
MTLLMTDHDEGVCIVSAKKNQFIKLNGFATGQKAITIDESLPSVSLQGASIYNCRDDAL